MKILSSLNLKNCFKDYNLIYFILLSFCLGSFFINLSLTLCLLIFFIRFKIVKIYINQFKFLFYLLISFWVIFVASTVINSPNDFKIIFKSFAHIRFMILPFVIIYMMQYVDKKKLIIFLNFIVIFLILDIFFQFYYKFDIFGYELSDLGNPRMDRISGFFGTELVAGTYLSLFGFLALFLLKEFKLFKNEVTVFTIYLLTLISAIIITGDRVGILFILGIIIFNIIFNNYFRKYFIAIFLIFGLVSFFLIKNVETLSERYFKKFDPILKTNFFNNPSYDGILNSPWISHYLVSWEMTKEKPLLGFGNKGFRKYCLKYEHKEKISDYKHKCTSHPHNTYFEILVETGFIGLIIFLILNLNIFIKVLKANNQSLYLIYSIIFTILNPFRPSGSFFTTWNGGIFWIIFGILLYFLFKSSNNLHEKNFNNNYS